VTRRDVRSVLSQEREKVMNDVRARLADEAKSFGIEIVDVRIKRVDLVADITDSVYRRMESERKQVANELRSQGAADAEKIRADADRQREVIIAEAYRDAQKIKGEGDAKFNYGGAMLHNLFFGNLTPPRAANKPSEISIEIIEKKYTSFDKFKEAVEKEFMAAQGSNWIYMDYEGKLHTIHNHEYRKGMKIALLVDAWEHAWSLDYQQDKAKYLNNIWRIINWKTVDIRLQGA
jgi:superoxide dismutase